MPAKDGNLPSANDLAHISQEDASQINQYIQKKQFVVSKEAEETVQDINLSSINKILDLNDYSANPSVCEETEKMCEHTKRMIWNGHQPCDLSITCPTFSPEGCTRFGVSIIGGDEPTKQQMCFKNGLISIYMQPQETIDIQVWSEMTTRYSLTCYAWCGTLNELPVKTATFTSDAVREDLYKTSLNVDNDTNPNKFG